MTDDARPRLGHRLEHAGFRAAQGLVLRFSHSAVRRFGRRFGRLYGRVDRRRRALVLENLRHALPELDAAERRRVTGDCFAAFGAMFFDLVSAARFDAADVERRFEVRGWEHLEDAEADGKGVFLLTGHFGSWQLASYYAGHRTGALHVLARPLNNPLTEADARRLRERWGNVQLGKRGGAHRMLNVVRKKGRVALLIDQRVRPPDGILVPFLGRPAWTPNALAMLSLHAKTPVVPARCVLAGEGEYRLELEPPIRPEGKGEAAETAFVGCLLEPVERWIRAEPELWMWMHRRWQKTSPARREATREAQRGDANLPETPRWDDLDEGLRRRLRVYRRAPWLERGESLRLESDGDEAARAGVALLHGALDLGHRAERRTAAELAETLPDPPDADARERFFRRLDKVALLLVEGGGSALGEVLAQRRGRRATVVVGDAPTDLVVGV